MDVFVNGERHALPEGSTVSQLIDALGLGERRLAVEINHEIVPRSAYPRYPVKDGDRIEIVRAIGGG
jgi:sulfur carrier protein